MEFLYERDMPEYVKNMTKEQLDKEIEILEKLPRITKADIKMRNNTAGELKQTIV